MPLLPDAIPYADHRSAALHVSVTIEAGPHASIQPDDGGYSSTPAVESQHLLELSSIHSICPLN
jgi:hypothetical protein